MDIQELLIQLMTLFVPNLMNLGAIKVNNYNAFNAVAQSLEMG